MPEFDQRWQQVNTQLNVNVVEQPDGSLVQRTLFQLPLGDWYNGPAAWGPATLDPSNAPAMVWPNVAGRIMEHMRAWYDQGWVPEEPPGPRHLALRYEWRVRTGIVAMHIAEMGFNILDSAFRNQSRIGKSALSPSDAQRWEAFAEAFSIVMTRHLHRLPEGG